MPIFSCERRRCVGLESIGSRRVLLAASSGAFPGSARFSPGWSVFCGARGQVSARRFLSVRAICARDRAPEGEMMTFVAFMARMRNPEDVVAGDVRRSARHGLVVGRSGGRFATVSAHQGTTEPTAGIGCVVGKWPSSRCRTVVSHADIAWSRDWVGMPVPLYPFRIPSTR